MFNKKTNLKFIKKVFPAMGGRVTINLQEMINDYEYRYFTCNGKIFEYDSQLKLMYSYTKETFCKKWCEWILDKIHDIQHDLNIDNPTTDDIEYMDYYYEIYKELKEAI